MFAIISLDEQHGKSPNIKSPEKTPKIKNKAKRRPDSPPQALGIEKKFWTM